MPKKRTPRIILALVLFFLIVLPLFTNGVDLLVDWLWFKQEGFRVIYRTILLTQIDLSGLVGIGFMVVTGLNLLIARGLAHRHGYRVNGEVHRVFGARPVRHSFPLAYLGGRSADWIRDGPMGHVPLAGVSDG